MREDAPADVEGAVAEFDVSPGKEGVLWSDGIPGITGMVGRTGELGTVVGCSADNSDALLAGTGPKKQNILNNIIIPIFLSIALSSDFVEYLRYPLAIPYKHNSIFYLFLVED